MPQVVSQPPQASGICDFYVSPEQTCGRAIHPAANHDPVPVCLMHSREPEKNGIKFQEEIERIINEAEKNVAVADFTGFVFPMADYSSRTFNVICRFNDATFAQETNFSEAKFTQGVSFFGAKFAQSVFFWRTVFPGNTDFQAAEFAQRAIFTQAVFLQTANFSEARFLQDVYFWNTKFLQDVTFWEAIFTGRAAFWQAKFKKGAYFGFASFLSTANFRETSFRRDFEDLPGLNFANAVFLHPEQIEFYKTDLGQALFYNCDISTVDFTLVTWRNRSRTNWFARSKRILYCSKRLLFWLKPSFRWKRKLVTWSRRQRPSRLCLYEETVVLDEADDLKPRLDSADERNYGLIAETYQQLKRNYDTKGDYWTAGNFHYGELEMQRLHSDRKLRPLRWLGRHVSLVALYKYASSYGESSTRPLIWLAVVILAFTLIFPATGLDLNPPAGEGRSIVTSLSYKHASSFFRANPAEHPKGWIGLFVHSGMAATSVAGFQKELRYTPSYPWGRALALLEVLLTTTLGGLSALAIRRQFKRS